eukprot:TRINITY_DN673_c0_g1_i1.p2 TRINITY_DN673_c0_g1~~TRINITY_DN673_c0_g1_i1.p2  ORF type:complete len:117 (-),score=27.17 TRINITY_DN673_c0_g1_i1:1550-1900(-)
MDTIREEDDEMDFHISETDVESSLSRSMSFSTSSSQSEREDGSMDLEPPRAMSMSQIESTLIFSSTGMSSFGQLDTKQKFELRFGVNLDDRKKRKLPPRRGSSPAQFTKVDQKATL